VQWHVPSGEVDDLRAGIDVLLIERSALAHRIPILVGASECRL
jgi:hypothetical protein